MENYLCAFEFWVSVALISVCHIILQASAPDTAVCAVKTWMQIFAVWKKRVDICPRGHNINCSKVTVPCATKEPQEATNFKLKQWKCTKFATSVWGTWPDLPEDAPSCSHCKWCAWFWPCAWPCGIFRESELVVLVSVCAAETLIRETFAQQLQLPRMCYWLSI